MSPPLPTLPCPLTPPTSNQGWSLLAIFTSTILGLILDPLPVGAWALIAVTVTLATNTLTFAQVRPRALALPISALALTLLISALPAAADVGGVCPTSTPLSLWPSLNQPYMI